MQRALRTSAGVAVSLRRLSCAAALALWACSSAPSPKAPAAPGARGAAASRLLHLRIVSSADTNGGTALHVLVRKTTKTDYPRQEYEDVAASLHLESDPDTLEWLVVSPAGTRDVWIARPSDVEVGVYFLFSDPRGRWKHLVEGASVNHVRFEVGRDEITSTRGLTHKLKGEE